MKWRELREAINQILDDEDEIETLMDETIVPEEKFLAEIERRKNNIPRA